MKDSPKSAALENPVGANSIAQRAREYQQLDRFFSKILDEALHLGATQIQFLLGPDGVLVTLRRDRVELKAIKLGSTWFTAIDRFLEERPSARWLEKAPSAGASAPRAAMRLAERIVSFRVQRDTKLGGQRTLVLDTLVVRGLDEVWEGLGLAGVTRARFQELVDIDHGLVLISGADETQVSSIVALVRVLGRATVVEGDFRNRWAEIQLVSETDPVFISTVTTDPIEAMVRLRAVTGTGALPPTWRGILTIGLIDRICPECARETAVDPELMKMLPPAAVPLGRATYVVGRRCDQCGQTGYQGVLALASIVVAEEAWFHLRFGAHDHSRAYAFAAERGVRPLLIEGAEQVFRGVTTLTALFQVAKSVPDGFLPFLATARAAAAPSSVKESDELPGDFFADSEAPVPLQGRAAFAGGQPESAVGPRPAARAVPQLLVVEDDPDQRNLLEMVLKAVPYEVRIAEDGRAGLDAVAKELPDLVITDLMMPRLDGAGFVRELKKNPQWAALPVLVLTVVADGDKEYELLDLGVDDYCEKTVQRKILLKRIHNVLRRRSATVAAR